MSVCGCAQLLQLLSRALEAVLMGVLGLGVSPETGGPWRCRLWQALRSFTVAGQHLDGFPIMCQGTASTLELLGPLVWPCAQWFPAGCCLEASPLGVAAQVDLALLCACVMPSMVEPLGTQQGGAEGSSALVFLSLLPGDAIQGDLVLAPNRSLSPWSPLICQGFCFLCDF